MKKRRISLYTLQRRMTKVVEPATSTPKSWGYSGVPGKGGKTTNAAIPVPKEDAE